MEKKFFFTKENLLIDTVMSEKLLKKFNQIYKENMCKEKIIHTNVLDLRKDDIIKIPLFLSLLNIIKKKFVLITGYKDLNFEKLWLVSSSSNDSSKTDLPYIPHIDKLRYFKAMVYLHDVNLEHGPIHLGKVKNATFAEQKRVKLPNDYKERGLNTIDDEYLDGNLTPITGKAGDVIFFDTNTPHKAGIIKDSYYRKVLRFDFERPNFNPKPSILNRIINKIIKK